MPINTSYKKMIENFNSEYRGGKTVCRKCTDDSSICASQKAWSVFFAYIRKKGIDETKASKDEKDLALESGDVACLEPKVINVKPKKKKEELEVSVDDIALKARLSEDIYSIDNLSLDVIHSYAHSIEDSFIHNIVVEEMEERGIKHLNYTPMDTTIAKLSAQEKSSVKADLLKHGWVDGYGGAGGFAYGYTQPEPIATPSDYSIVQNKMGYYDVICKGDGLVKATVENEEQAKKYVEKLCTDHLAPQYMSASK